MNAKRLLIIQVLIEGLIPILGYLYWNWDASFIFLFYLIDWVLHWTLSAVKARKCLSVQHLKQEEHRKTYIQLYFGLSGITISAILIFFLMLNVHSQFSWSERIWAFLSYSDMGIPQGFILPPLLIFSGIVEYKQKFLRFELFKKIPAFAFTAKTQQQAFITIPIFSTVFALSYFVEISDSILLFGTVSGVIGYRLWFRNELGI